MENLCSSSELPFILRIPYTLPTNFQGFLLPTVSFFLLADCYAHETLAAYIYFYIRANTPELVLYCPAFATECHLLERYPFIVNSPLS